jgi:cytochrome c
MDSMEVNKIVASVLVAGIAFFLVGTIGVNVVTEHVPAKTAIKINVQEAAAPAAEAGPKPLPPIAPLLAKADLAVGEKYVKTVCSACHTFNEGGKAGVGPNLYNVVGGPHAHMEGFNYSNALKSKKGPWTFAELNEWLHKPSEYAPGTRMTFAGISNDQTRADVIDYLHTLSPHPEPLPPANAQPAATPAAAGSSAPAAPGASAPQAQQPAPGSVANAGSAAPVAPPGHSGPAPATTAPAAPAPVPAQPAGSPAVGGATK